MSSRHLIVLAVACAAALTSTSIAQQRLAQDVAFVRKLATKLRFIELATEEAENLQKTHKQSDDFKLVSQLGIEIRLIGARAHPNREERRTLFKEALEKSSEFIDRYSGDSVADDARVTMVQACVNYGEFLLEEIEVARSEAPDTVKELEEKAATAFRHGIDTCDAFLDANRRKIDDDEEIRSKYYYVWLNKAILQRENGRAVKRDREPLCSLARETFEELILEIGEESLLGLRGYFEMSKINEVLGAYPDAVGEYQDTIDGIVEAMTSEELELAQWTQDRLFELMQEAYDAAARALLQDGATDKVLALCKQFRGHLNDKRLTGLDGDQDPFEVASPSKGHPVFLTEARAMAESGDPAQVSAALTQIKLINQKHPNDIIGIRAKALLKNVMQLAGSDSSIVTGESLFEVAKGDYQSRNYEAAIRGFKRAYAAMTDAEREKLGLELWTLSGRCYGVQKRYVEAALAFAEGLDKFGAKSETAPATAENLDRAWSAFMHSCRNDDDSAVRTLGTRVNSLLNRFGGESNAAKRLWKEANKLVRTRKYAQADGQLSQIATDSPYYEPAQSLRVVCLQQLKKADEAEKVMAAYLSYIAKTPVPSDDKTGQANRRAQTEAAMAHHSNAIAYSRVNPSKGTKDPTKFPALIAKISNFIDTYGTLGREYFPKAFDMRARLLCELGELEKAEESYRTLKKDFAGHQYLPGLATRIFASHRERVKALETEFKSMIKAGNAQNTRTTQDNLQAARRAALAIGLDYSQSAPKPLYSILSNSLNLAKAISDWPTVEKLGLQIQERYGKDPKNGKKVTRFVKPAIGEALVRQKRFRDAETMLRESIEANPKNYPLKRFLALTLGGWIDVDDSLNEIEVAGLDRPDEAYLIMYQEYRKYVMSKFKKYSIEWYTAQWEMFLFAKRAIPKEDKFKRYAQTLYNQANANEDFVTLKSLGPDGERLFNLFINHRVR